MTPFVFDFSFDKAKMTYIPNPKEGSETGPSFLNLTGENMCPYLAEREQIELCPKYGFFVFFNSSSSLMPLTLSLPPHSKILKNTLFRIEKFWARKFWIRKGRG